MAQAESSRLSYSAPEGCPAEAVFVSALEARGASLEHGGAARLLDVRTPLKYDPDGRVLELCFEIAAGAIWLATRDAAGNRTQNKMTGIGTARLEAHTQHSIGSSLYLDLNLGGEMWLGKVSAERPDGSQLFHSSTFNAYALAGLGLRFW